MGRSNIKRKPSVLSISRPRCCSTSARARRSCLRMMLAAFWSPMRSTSAVESAMSQTTSVRSCGVAMRPGPGAVSNWRISAVMVGSMLQGFRHSGEGRNPLLRFPSMELDPGQFHGRDDDTASTHHVGAVAARALDVVQGAIGFAVPHRPFVVVAAQPAADADGHGEFRRGFRKTQLAYAFGDAQGALGQLALVGHL